VIGIDGHDLAGAVCLTTVAQPAAEQGRLGAATVLARLGHGVVEYPAGRVMPAARLIVRDSTAPPATG